MKYSLILLSLLALAGCKEAPQSTQSVGNFKVEKLFEVDGCTVYRFYDDRTVYFTNCGNKPTTSYTESCGKNCTRTMSN